MGDKVELSLYTWEEIKKIFFDKKFDNIDAKSIYYALTFIGKFLKKNILTPNNLNYPISRIKLENYFR